MERKNISVVSLEDLDPQPTLATIDLSYLSLKKAVPVVSDLLAFPRAILALVKPLFEVTDAASKRSGVIEHPKVFRDVLEDLLDHCARSRLLVHGVCASPITGNRGTREFFVLLSADRTFRRVPSRRELSDQVRVSVKSAQALTQYRR
jgi:23S rRNA (cytidine1920-2'-O)/16S rRNA (cytidine1409-2'-O)-methyltransferase